MSKNETITSQEESQLTALFAQVRKAEVEVPPYMKARVLAHLRQDQKQVRGSLFFWKALSLGSLMSLLFLGIFSFNLYQKSTSDGITQQAYVIHIDFNSEDRGLVAKAEIELPKDVHFVSSKKQIREERSLTLPVDIKAVGRGKLPFVVSSSFSGEKDIKVRLLNENNELVREKVLKLKFARQGLIL